MKLLYVFSGILFLFLFLENAYSKDEINSSLNSEGISNETSSCGLDEKATPTLEQISDTQDIINKIINDKRYGLGSYEKLFLKTLANRSDEMSEFKIKILILNDNISKVLNTWFLNLDSEEKKRGSAKYKTFHQIDNLLKESYDLAYDDKWLQNKNIEERIFYLDTIVQEYGNKMMSDSVSKTDEDIFFRNVTRYLSKFTG